MESQKERRYNMDYEELYRQLMILKKAPMSERNIQFLIRTIGEFPDALEIYKNHFANEQQIQKMISNGVNGAAAAQHILENSQIEIRTSNSLELTYKYYGYVRSITPQLLDQLIDEVVNRIQLENEYSRVAGVNSPMQEQEDELTLNELQQFC